MKNLIAVGFVLCAVLMTSSRVFGQPGQEHFGRVWVQGQALVYTTTFGTGVTPFNQIIVPITSTGQRYFTIGNSNICDSAGNLLLISDGFHLYDKNANLIDGGQNLAPPFITSYYNHSIAAQSSIILPFENGKYRLITPTASDDSFLYNWLHVGSGALFDLLLYSEVDMTANGGLGKVVKRMAPLLEGARLSKTQMMACRHGDGKSWWLLKHASDTNLIYTFLLTQDSVYGPYIQGFSGDAAYFGYRDIVGQSMFSGDGRQYATTIEGYGKVFVADFDRCNGKLSNPKVYEVPPREVQTPFPPTFLEGSTNGLAFSPNGCFLYVSNDYGIQQLDLLNSASSSAWTQVGTMDTSFENFQLYSNIYPGPDGKLYIGNFNGGYGEMSVIDSPDNPGLAAAFCRKCLRFPGYYINDIYRNAGVAIPPCMPNYALGPSNPICYPTGINAPEVKAPVFTLYPNPAHGLVNVRCGAPGKLQVFDVIGRKISSTLITKSDMQVNISSCAPGIYQCRFTDKYGHQKSSKLVVDR